MKANWKEFDELKITNCNLLVDAIKLLKITSTRENTGNCTYVAYVDCLVFTFSIHTLLLITRVLIGEVFTKLPFE